MQIQSYINSNYISANHLFIKNNPFTLEPMHQVQCCDLLQAVQAINGAQLAFSEWKTASLQDRIVMLENIIICLTEQKKEFAKLEAADQGLSIKFVEDQCIVAAITAFETAVTQLRNFNSSENSIYTAVGVVTLVASWNLSLRIVCERLAPALAAGNAVVIKVSSAAPVTAFILSQILAKANIPKGLVQVLVSDELDIKNLLVSHPAIKAVSFVGNLEHSSQVLKLIAEQSFNQFKKIQIASGSKNSAIALMEPDANCFLEIMNSFLIGQGQLSWNSNRLFVLEKYENQWVEKIKSFLEGLVPAASAEDPSLWGPCIKAQSFSHFSEIEEMAKTDQASLLQTTFKLTQQQKKCFLKPTFTKDMSNCSTLQQDQVAAPLFILSVVKYPFDIAKYSNVSYYGQTAHIWAEDNKILKVAESLDVARVFKNRWSIYDHQPNIGVKQSAFGLQDYRVFGDFFSNVKVLT